MPDSISVALDFSGDRASQCPFSTSCSFPRFLSFASFFFLFFFCPLLLRRHPFLPFRRLGCACLDHASFAGFLQGYLRLAMPRCLYFFGLTRFFFFPFCILLASCPWLRLPRVPRSLIAPTKKKKRLSSFSRVFSLITCLYFIAPDAALLFILTFPLRRFGVTAKVHFPTKGNVTKRGQT